MTPATLSALLLADIAKTTDTAATEHKVWLVRSINAALEEIRRAVPSHYIRRAGFVTRPVQSIAATPSDHETIALAGDTTGENDGRSIVFAGRWGRLYWIGSTYRITPPLVSTAAGTASVWTDAFAMPSWATGVAGAITLNGVPMQVIGNREAAETFLRYGNDYGEVNTTDWRSRVYGRPRACWVESASTGDDTLDPTRLLLRVFPMPDAVYTIEADFHVNPGLLSVSDLTSTSITFNIPTGDADGILLPIARRKWSASPWWAAEKSLKHISADYAEALAALANYRANSAAKMMMAAEYF